MLEPFPVKFVDSSLVAVFDKAKPPLVWNFDLKKNPHFTLALQQAHTGWQLGVQSIRGEFDIVASFANQEDALEAFTNVQTLLLKGRRSFLKWMLISNLIVVAVMVSLFSLFRHERAEFLAARSANPGVVMSHQAQVPHAKEMKTGVPVSADDVLTPPP